MNGIIIPEPSTSFPVFLRARRRAGADFVYCTDLASTSSASSSSPRIAINVARSASENSRNATARPGASSRSQSRDLIPFRWRSVFLLL
jgi:hypothetical protein